MTQAHKQIVESLKRIAQSKGTREDYARCSAAGLTGDWPNPQGPGMYPAGWVVLGVVEELDRALRGITEILQTCEPTADSVLEAVREVDEMARKNGQEAWAQGRRISAIMRAIGEANEQYEKDANP